MCRLDPQCHYLHKRRWGCHRRGFPRLGLSAPTMAHHLILMPQLSDLPYLSYAQTALTYVLLSSNDCKSLGGALSVLWWSQFSSRAHDLGLLHMSLRHFLAYRLHWARSSLLWRWKRLHQCDHDGHGLATLLLPRFSQSVAHDLCIDHQHCCRIAAPGLPQSLRGHQESVLRSFG